jgi:hypothetical protein
MSGATVTMDRSKSTIRRGSRFLDTQIARAVRDRKAVKVTSPSGQDWITGFVFGMDDYSLGVVSREGAKMVIHKSAAAVISLDQNVEWNQSLASICDPFRETVMQEHFGQTSTAR